MERATLLDLLARAEQHMVFGKRQIDNQYRIIAKLAGPGATGLLRLATITPHLQF